MESAESEEIEESPQVLGDRQNPKSPKKEKKPKPLNTKDRVEILEGIVVDQRALIDALIAADVLLRAADVELKAADVELKAADVLLQAADVAIVGRLDIAEPAITAVEGRLDTAEPKITAQGK